MDLFLPLDGTACGGLAGPSTGVTTRFLDEIAPGVARAQCKDSGSMSSGLFGGGNPFVEVGVWSLAPLS